MANETKDSFLAGLEEPNVEVGNDLELFPEEKEEVQEEEKEIPFHKNEKLQRYVEKEVSKRLKDFKPSAEQTFKQEVQGDDKLVSALTRLVGNDTDEKKAVLADLKSALDERDERASQRAYERLQAIQEESEQQEQAEIVEAVDELEEGREEIESSYGKPLTDRQWSAYKDFLLDIEPKGGYEEYPDFIKTFDYFRKSVSRSNAQAKSLASRGMERSAPASTEAPKGNSWSDWEAEKEKLLERMK